MQRSLEFTSFFLVLASPEWKTVKKNKVVKRKLEPASKDIESNPKTVSPLPIMVTTLTYPFVSDNFDYDDEEYIYYDEWIPIDASNEIQSN